jgi:hypothetical protein
MMFILAVFATGLSFLPHGKPTYVVNTPEAQVLIDWIRERGGYVDPRLSIRHEVPTDLTTIRGVFSEAPIVEGELLLRVPWELCIAPTAPKSESNCATTSQCLCDTELNLRETLNKGNASMHGPYVQLLLDKKLELPDLWSDEELALLIRLLGNELPPKPERLTSHSKWWSSECHGDLSDPLALKSLLLLVTRGVQVYDPEWTIMTPVFDFLNHRNGAWTNTRLGSGAMEDFELYADKGIAAGEQLYFSYNWGPDELFIHYSFVEQYPQQWAFEVDDSFGISSSFQRVEFTLDEAEETAGSQNSSTSNTVLWEGGSPQDCVPSLEVVTALERLLERLKIRRAAEFMDNTTNESPHFGLIEAYVSAVQMALEAAVTAGYAFHNDYNEKNAAVMSRRSETPPEEL